MRWVLGDVKKLQIRLQRYYTNALTTRRTLRYGAILLKVIV